MYRERARSLRAGLVFAFHWRENGGVGEWVPPQCKEVIESGQKESKKVLFPGANFRPWFRWWLSPPSFPPMGLMELRTPPALLEARTILRKILLKRRARSIILACNVQQFLTCPSIQ